VVDDDTFQPYSGKILINQIVIEKDIGEKYFCSEEEAISAGFIKASGCP
jgi:hypothetical protein